MTLLTTAEISTLVSSDFKCNDDTKVIIHPFSEKCITNLGYDLRVGNYYTTSELNHQIKLDAGQKIVINPKSTALIESLEHVKMPMALNIIGLVKSQSKFKSKSFTYLSTIIEAGWNNTILISVYNHSNEKIELNHGDNLCTITFLDINQPQKYV